METNDKEKYLSAWDSHIGALATLRWTKDEEASERIGEIIDELRVLLKRVADSKEFKGVSE